jgi:hypothetical protein
LDVNLWMIPNHMRPSFSIKALRKGALEKPGSFRDRIYLTDVGDALWRTAMAMSPDAVLQLRSHKNYLMNKADVSMSGLWVQIEGHKLGLSSWSSAFRVRLVGDEPRVIGYLEKFLKALGRMPFNSPYWGQNEWDIMQREHSVTRASLIGEWKRSLPMHPWGQD